MADSIRSGIRRSSDIIVVAAALTPEVLFQRTMGISPNIQPYTVGLKKIWCYSNVGNVIVTIGQGLGILFAAIIPPFLCINGRETAFDEDIIPYTDIGADLTVQATILGVQVMVEVEELVLVIEWPRMLHLEEFTQERKLFNEEKESNPLKKVFPCQL